MKVAPKGFPNLDLILNNAVDARNHFVHGADVNDAKAAFYRDMLSVHVDALEFVFCAAELLDSGWNYGAWAQKPKTFRHPMSYFERNFKIIQKQYVEEWQAIG